MKKIFVFLSIFFLLLFTSIIKNSTKKIEQKIYNMKENISILKIQYEIVKLDHDYLTSPSKLSAFKKKYFKDEFNHFEISNVKKINIKDNNLINN
jgi:hypothetical protein